jgi:hypothetical protein
VCKHAADDTCVCQQQQQQQQNTNQNCSILADSPGMTAMGRPAAACAAPSTAASTASRAGVTNWLGGTPSSHSTASSLGSSANLAAGHQHCIKGFSTRSCLVSDQRLRLHVFSHGC